jgi:Phosphoenolpyruvate carboxykinase (GTP)
VGKVGVIKNDPMAMRPFCGYNMADYFDHMRNILRKLERPVKIFNVNWFRVDENGKFIWPGFGENIRVIKWAIDRLNGNVDFYFNADRYCTKCRRNRCAWLKYR